MTFPKHQTLCSSSGTKRSGRGSGLCMHAPVVLPVVRGLLDLGFAALAAPRQSCTCSCPACQCPEHKGDCPALERLLGEQLGSRRASSLAEGSPFDLWWVIKLVLAGILVGFIIGVAGIYLLVLRYRPRTSSTSEALAVPESRGPMTPQQRR